MSGRPASGGATAVTYERRAVRMDALADKAVRGSDMEQAFRKLAIAYRELAQVIESRTDQIL